MSEEVDSPESFEEAGTGARRNILVEHWGFLKHEKKWWLLPILVGLLLVGALVVAGGSAAAPFIYTLF